MISISSKHFKRVFTLMSFLFLFSTAAPVFSQQILASFGFGVQSVEYASEVSLWTYEYTTASFTTLGVNVFFVGRSGFTVSAGTDFGFNFDIGLGVDPVFGLGYVYYDVLYLGGILNVIPSPSRYDGSIAPTLVAGFDFGHFLLQAQLSYKYGIVSAMENRSPHGIRFLIGAGVNVGNLRR